MTLQDKKMKEQYGDDWVKVNSAPKRVYELAEELAHLQSRRFEIAHYLPGMQSFIDRMNEPAAKAVGFNSYAEMQEWCRKENWSPEDDDRLQKFENAVAGIKAKIQPELDDFISMVKYQRQHILAENIRAVQNAMLRISDVYIYHAGDDLYTIRCKIDGVKQPGKSLDTSNDAFDKKEDRQALAASVFRDELFGQSRSMGLKR